MTEFPSIRSIADVIAVICDAIRMLAASDDSEAGLDRLDEALAGLEQAPNESRKGNFTGSGPLEHGLAAIKELSRAQVALAHDEIERAESYIQSAGHQLAAAAHIVRAAAEPAERVVGEASPGPVQLSVSEALRVPNREAISDSLRNLLERSEAEAFVIFVDARTGNFCQFIGSQKGPLLLDLPFSSLSDAERRRARRFFAECGYERVEGEEGFLVELGRDIGEGTKLAVGTFKNVYRADPDFSLKIEEN